MTWWKKQPPQGEDWCHIGLHEDYMTGTPEHVVCARCYRISGPVSFNGRTAAFGAADRGSSPRAGAK